MNHVLSWCLVAATLLALPVAAAARPNVTMEAAAGVGGIVKAARWASLRVGIASAERAFHGELHVSWGDRELRRAVSLPSPGQRQFELYVRTSDPRGAIRVRLIAADQVVETIDVPVRIVAATEAVTLWVVSRDGAVPHGPCAATASADRLPRSPRGYEAIDAIVWPGGGIDLSADQRAALTQWQRFRALEQSGDLGLAPQPKRPMFRRGLSGPVAQQVAAAGLLYAAALMLAGIATSRRRVGIASTALWVAGVTVTATGAAHAIGRAAVGRHVVVHHDSVLNQIPGTGASVLSTRGVVEFPAFADFVIELPVSDGNIDAGPSNGRAAERIGDDGRPFVSGRYGLGARLAYTAEAVVDRQPLSVTTSGDTTTVANRSGTILQHCRFADGFTKTEIGRMDPGAVVAARQVSEVLGPMFTCDASDALVPLAAPGRALEMRGTTTIAVYQERSDAERGADD